MRAFIIASRNHGKILEIQSALSSLPLRFLSLQDFPAIPNIAEDGHSYEENAFKKAQAVLEATGEWALADDSGIEVDSLGGQPGLHTADYAGPGASGAAINQKMLKALDGVPIEKRGARGVCVLALHRSGMPPQYFKGTCQGLILEAPRGTHGFGFDSIFFFPPLNKCFGELSALEKNRVSHRAAALNLLKNYLQETL